MFNIYKNPMISYGRHLNLYRIEKEGSLEKGASEELRGCSQTGSNPNPGLHSMNE
jgi:hypothetical protein